MKELGIGLSESCQSEKFQKIRAVLSIGVENLRPNICDNRLELLKCWRQSDWFFALEQKWPVLSRAARPKHDETFTRWFRRMIYRVRKSFRRHVVHQAGQCRSWLRLCHALFFPFDSMLPTPQRNVQLQRCCAEPARARAPSQQSAIRCSLSAALAFVPSAQASCRQ